MSRISLSVTMREIAGAVVGGLLSPISGALSAVRRSRMFHPRGIVCHAVVESLGYELGTEALVRFSSAWWKTGEWPDVLGCAVRFGVAPIREHAVELDQDLLFATTRRPWTLPFAPLATRQHDFFAQPLYAVSPFRERALGRIELRLRPFSEGPSDLSRADKLAALIERRAAALVLEWAPYRPFWKIGDDRSFRPLVRLDIDRVVELDQEALRFDPFQNGAGLVPMGYVQALRHATYATSRAARPESEHP